MFVLPAAQVVARLAPNTAVRQQRARTAVTLTRWLAGQPDPTALAPIPGEQPVITDDTVGMFWPLRTTSPPPTVTDLARPLRRLHALPAPPLVVPEYQPLDRLRVALDLDRHRPQSALTPEDNTWLRHRAEDIVTAYGATEFPLGTGLIHADAHAENLVRQGADRVLIDWDGAAIGPRELDLVTGMPNHFHERRERREQFLTAYGYDLLAWCGWRALRDLIALRALGSYLRLAASSPDAATEPQRRVSSLRTGDRAAQWEALG